MVVNNQSARPSTSVLIDYYIISYRVRRKSDAVSASTPEMSAAPEGRGREFESRSASRRSSIRARRGRLVTSGALSADRPNALQEAKLNMESYGPASVQSVDPA